MGYMYPACWPKNQLELYLHQTGDLMQTLGMTSLNILDVDPVYRTGLPWLAAFSWRGMRLTNPSIQHQFAQVLSNYGVRGMLNGAGFTGLPGHWKNLDHFPLYNNLGFTETVEQTVRLIKLAQRLYRKRPLFLNVYLIAWKMTPTLVQQVIRQLGAEYEYVLPSTLLSLLPL
jgi:hypothetical protein